MARARIFQQRGGKRIRYMACVAAIFLAASVCAAQSAPAGQRSETPWAKDLDKYPGLLPELGLLIIKLQHSVQFPAERTESRLLPLLPGSTVSYAAFPNYGEAAHQALLIFQQELKDSSALRNWWEHGELAATGPKIEDSLEKLYQLHQYLGDEIVVSGTLEGREPKLLVIAEVRKPGLKEFLEQILNQAAGKSQRPVRVLDPHDLAGAKDQSAAQQFLVLVRPDFVVGAMDLATLRNFNARLDRHSREFDSTPFGQRVAQEYVGGVKILAAADLNHILNQLPPGAQQDPKFRQSGFADMKYLIWDRKGAGAQAFSQLELSFNGPRRGPAAWLGKPAPLDSLDFVSPKAMMTVSMVLSNPAQIFDDVKQLAGPASSGFAAIAGGEKALNLSLKEDLLRLLGGELTLELDSITPPQPEWKAILRVNDANRLRQTLTTLLAAMNIQEQQVDDGGLNYYTVRIPAPKGMLEVGYAFSDGYLIIGSSRDTVAGAIALHKSGGSLRKSQKFLASLPPGHPLDSSALFYEDPIAMAALQLRQFSPEMAESVARLSGGMTPYIACLYGEDTAIREESRSGAFDVGAVLVAAAIVIPNLLHSKIASNEASAVGSMRTVNVAQVGYSATYPQRGFARNLASFGPDPRGPNTESADHAGLLDGTLANESCTTEAWCTKSGFRFRVTAVCKQDKCGEYVVVATPVDSNTGGRNFCSTSDGVIRSKMAPPLSSPVGVSDCRTWPPLQ